MEWMIEMTIRTGDCAQGLTLAAEPGERVDLNEHIGRTKVVLLFYPFAFSGVCTVEWCTMRDDWAQWTELGAEVFGVSIDSPYVCRKFREEENIPFPLLSDFNRDLATAYDVLHDDLGGLKRVAKRAVFVIGTARWRMTG